MSVPKKHAEWLDQLADMVAKGDTLPTDPSTMEHAVTVALEYRAEADTWRALFDEIACDSLLRAVADHFDPYGAANQVLGWEEIQAALVQFRTPRPYGRGDSDE